MKQGFSDWRIIQPRVEMKLDTDSAFIAHYNAYQFPGFAGDFQQHSVFLLTLLRLEAG